MRIAVDAMGGDNAPTAVVEGAVLAAREYQIEVLLVGQQEVIKRTLRGSDLGKANIEVIHASQVVQMDGSAIEAVRRKRDSSIAVAAQLLKDGEADAMVSAGNTAAVYATTRAFLGKLRGVSRPAIPAIFPNMVDLTILLDVGANAGGCKPEDFLQFAIMGEAYSRDVMGKENPRVGLLSVGEEESKGSLVTLGALPLLGQLPINFIGNVEGRDIINGTTDVVVCDGFVGNVILKFAEGMSEAIFDLLKEELSRSVLAKLGVLLARSALRKVRKRVDYAEYGGSPLLGLQGACIICHGKSDSYAIKNAIRVASEFVSHNVNQHIEENIQVIKEINT
ncbi:phosphate acyltransferase PlsX [Candidatus Poribacteria bacterium]